MYATGRRPNTRGHGAGRGRRRLTAPTARSWSTNTRRPAVPQHLRRRRRHRPAQPDAGGDPRGPRLRRDRVRQEADRRRSRQTCRHAVFSSRRVGVVGLTEAGAPPSRRVDIYRTSFRPLKHTLSGRDEKMHDEAGGRRAPAERVLGCQMVGLDAAEMIQIAGDRREDGRDQGQFDRPSPSTRPPPRSSSPSPSPGKANRAAYPQSWNGK